VLIAPVWNTQPWFPTLLSMLIDHPRLIIPNPRKPISRDPMPLLLQLTVWHISGISSKVRIFQKKLQYSSSSHGGLWCDSLFGKWHSWCVELSFNPFLGPIVSVANFLAQLCAKGYQMRKWLGIMWDNTQLYPDYLKASSMIGLPYQMYLHLESSNCVELSGRPGRKSILLLQGIIMEISHVTCPESPFRSRPDKKIVQTK